MYGPLRNGRKLHMISHPVEAGTLHMKSHWENVHILCQQKTRIFMPPLPDLVMFSLTRVR